MNQEKACIRAQVEREHHLTSVISFGTCRYKSAVPTALLLDPPPLISPYILERVLSSVLAWTSSGLARFVLVLVWCCSAGCVGVGLNLFQLTDLFAYVKRSPTPEEPLTQTQSSCNRRTSHRLLSLLHLFNLSPRCKCRHKHSWKQDVE